MAEPYAPLEDLRALRARGLSYNEIGKVLGVTRQAVHQRLNPRARPTEPRPYRGRGVIWPPPNEARLWA